MQQKYSPTHSNGKLCVIEMLTYFFLNVELEATDLTFPTSIKPFGKNAALVYKLVKSSAYAIKSIDRWLFTRVLNAFAGLKRRVPLSFNALTDLRPSCKSLFRLIPVFWQIDVLLFCVVVIQLMRKLQRLVFDVQPVIS